METGHYSMAADGKLKAEVARIMVKTGQAANHTGRSGREFEVVEVLSDQHLENSGDYSVFCLSYKYSDLLSSIAIQLGCILS